MARSGHLAGVAVKIGWKSPGEKGWEPIFRVCRGRDTGDFGRSGRSRPTPVSGNTGEAGDEPGGQKRRVPPGCGENRRLMRRNARPYCRCALRVAPVIRRFSHAARLARNPEN